MFIFRHLLLFDKIKYLCRSTSHNNSFCGLYTEFYHGMRNISTIYITVFIKYTCLNVFQLQIFMEYRYSLVAGKYRNFRHIAVGVGDNFRKLWGELITISVYAYSLKMIGMERKIKYGKKSNQ